MKTIAVGDKATRSKTVSEKDFELFTELTGDRQSVHYDERVAKAAGFRGRIAHGGVITGLFHTLIAHDLPGEGSVFLNVNWNFRKAVILGDTITVTVEVKNIREDKPLVTLTTTVKNQLGEVCLDGEAVVYVLPVSQAENP